MGRRRQWRDLRRAQPGERFAAGRRAELWRGRNPARHRGRRRRLAGVAGADGKAARAIVAALVRADHRQRRRPGAADHRRMRQAAGRSEGRSHLRRVLRRMVCRGRQARLWRNDPRDGGGQAAGGHQAADRRLRGDHAVEFPAGDDHAQGRPGAGRRLHGGGQARRADAADGAGAGGTGRAGRFSAGCSMS